MRKTADIINACIDMYDRADGNQAFSVGFRAALGWVIRYAEEEQDETDQIHERD